MYAFPPAAGAIMWIVSGDPAVSLGFFGASLAAVGGVLSHLYGTQLQAADSTAEHAERSRLENTLEV